MLLILSSCSNNYRQNNKTGNKDSSSTTDFVKPAADTLVKSGYFTVEGDSLIIPSFEIEVSLSPKAEAKLAADKETVIVSATFSGVPKDTTSQDYLNFGDIDFLDSDIELSSSRLAKFENIKFSKSLYDSLADKDIHLSIDVFSGRRSTKDNLIDCSGIQDKMSNIKGKRFTVTGKLIYGDD